MGASGTLIGGAAAAAIYSSRNIAASNATTTYGAPALPTDAGASVRPGTGSALLFVESAVTGNFARVQRAAAAVGGGNVTNGGGSGAATSGSERRERGAGAAAGSEKSSKGPASAAETFMLTKLRARTQGGWLSHIADGVAGVSVVGEGVGAEPPQDIKPGETLFTGYATLIGRTARCAEGILTGCLLLIAILLARQPSGSTILHFMNIVGWQIEGLRFLQFFLTWIAWVGAASEYSRSKDLLASLINRHNARASGAAAEDEGAVAVSLAAVARVNAIAALSWRIKALTVCVFAHTLTCIFIVSSSSIDSRLRVAAIQAATSDRVYHDTAVFPSTSAADVESWTTLIYLRFISSFIAYIASNAALASSDSMLIAR